MSYEAIALYLLGMAPMHSVLARISGYSELPRWLWVGGLIAWPVIALGFFASLLLGWTDSSGEPKRRDTRWL